VDFEAVVDTLDKIGYQGYLSGEFLPKPDADTAAQKAIATMKPRLVL
jgi:sugar phosphate isomerase/epimerase